MSDFGDRLVSLDSSDWEFAVRIDVRRRAPTAFVSSNWKFGKRLLDATGQPFTNVEQLFFHAANQLGISER